MQPVKPALCESVSAAALRRVVGWFLSRFVDRLAMNSVRCFVMICQGQPAISHPHQDGPHFRMGLGLGETETTICFLREVQMLRHRIPRRQVRKPFGTARDCWSPAKAKLC
jgi:hypothetical protein